MKTRLPLLLVFVSIALSFCACENYNRTREIKKVQRAWIGKTIRFPADIQPENSGKDTLWQIQETPYKILLYIDTVGCTSCKLLLIVWNKLIEEVEADMKGQASFLFYFHPKDKKELNFIFRKDRFYHPVFIDDENEIGRLNKFPQQIEYQCFLLNKDNRVVCIGNPTLNPYIWEMYKKIIMTAPKQIKALSP